jgi:HAD superfamily hydrolase (TIGR01450 family)
MIVCCDLDGVLWRGDEPIPGSAEAVARLRSAGLRVGFLTNNASGRVADNLAKLRRFGIDAEPNDVVSSAQAAAALLQSELTAGARVLVCGGPGVIEAVEAAGFAAVDDEPADAVVVGWTPAFDFEQLRRAADVARGDGCFVATNTDPTYPVPGGLVPGAGALVAAVATAAGRTPDVAGKPAAAMVAIVRERFGASGVVVGDRPSTDGALADALEWPFALVLSGVAGPGSEEDVPDPPPAFVGADLARLVPRLIHTYAHA